MAVLKCKMCGGSLDITEGMTVCECEYCGTMQTIPQIDDEKKITLFTRANRLRAACEFDKAAGVYENIVSDFPEEAEAYWGLVLCKFGIEYVDDPATGKKIPTCHRSSFESIMDNPDFEQTMENADPIARKVYREEAKTIDGIQKGILEISGKEEPYDIFICYKETDDSGERTVDSVIAQDVYDALTEKGYKVFFSRITLEDKLGQEYEPYIFAALNSAKVMLAFGTDYEYYNAVWVKNEWSRFLSLIEKGAKKTLIPCYKGIDAYDMPKEFARLQAQDMGKIGAIQDLLRGISKILGSKSQATNVGYNAAANPEASALTRRGNMALEDGDFENASNYFERALDANPSDARAYLGKFLAYYGLTSLADLDDKVCLLDDNKEFRRAEQFADPALAKELKTVKDANSVKIERLRLIDALRQVAEKKAVQESLRLMTHCTDEAYNEALSLFDVIAESKCIKATKARDYKRNAECQFFALKFLRSNLEVYSSLQINTAARDAHILFRSGVLDKLANEGLIEKHPEGYCWPGAKEEKERLLREAEELRQKQIRQKAAYNEACARINGQIQDEVSAAKTAVDEEFDPKLRGIQREIKEAVDEANRQREAIQRQISDWRSQQSALGFFKGKEKKALQVQIDEAQSRLSKIPSQQDIQAGYQQKISQINSEKQEALNKKSAEIRSRYTMPKLEDFAEV